MNTLQSIVNEYLIYCHSQKCLDSKTLKAYRIDLRQFCEANDNLVISNISSVVLESYISYLHATYKPKSAKRKIATLKAFFHYLEYRDYIANNPFSKLQIKFREPIILPKTIPLNILERFLSTIYQQLSLARSDYQYKNILRDIAVIELLFATGIRISELCSLTPLDVNLNSRTILIYGKGAKERIIQIGNADVQKILIRYENEFRKEMLQTNHFFINHLGNPLSDQSVRRMIRKYTTLSEINLHITPHMFRHTFATALLDAEVDIRYIQEMLGHSSINITEIYTHVATAKQMQILSTKHPRINLHIN